MKLAFAAATLLALSPVLATAQQAPRGSRAPAPYDARGPAPAGAYPYSTPYSGQGPVCIPWCPGDLNPCDPPDFKRADGRCFQEG